MKPTKLQVVRECRKLQKLNPEQKLRTKFCNDAKEWVVQLWIKEDKEWLCLHN